MRPKDYLTATIFLMLGFLSSQGLIFIVARLSGVTCQ